VWPSTYEGQVAAATAKLLQDMAQRQAQAQQQQQQQQEQGV
jgi:hypothetical protein